MRAVTGQTRLSHGAVAEVINATLATIQRALSHEQNVTLGGFGTICTRHQKEGKVRSIHSGEVVTLPARQVAALRRATLALADGANGCKSQRAPAIASSSWPA